MPDEPTQQDEAAIRRIAKKVHASVKDIDTEISAEAEKISQQVGISKERAEKMLREEIAEVPDDEDPEANPPKDDPPEPEHFMRRRVFGNK